MIEGDVQNTKGWIVWHLYLNLLLRQNNNNILGNFFAKVDTFEK